MKAIAMRFGVPFAGAAPMPGGIGVLAVVAVSEPRPLVLLVDLQSANKGASVTNAMEACIGYVLSRLELDLPGTTLGQIDWVQLDSDGWFDVVQARWAAAAPALLVDWMPLRAAGAEPRTLRAFQALYDDAAAIALGEVQRYVDEHNLVLRVRQTDETPS